MKEELYTILAYLEHEEDEILITRNSILQLDISQPDALEDKIIYLKNFINQANYKNHDYLGYYYLFLGCIYYEKGEYENVTSSLQRANPELWKSQINKALAHWLLGINYSCVNKYPKAREELKDALNILWVNARINSSQVEEQQQLKSIIRERIHQAHINIEKKSAHYASLPSRIQETQKLPHHNIIEKMRRKFVPPNTSLPEQTSYEQSSEEKPEDINRISVQSTKPHTIHVTIPIDVSALENIPVASDCLTPDLAKKLRDFTEFIK